jgi:hypothetical protein
VKSPEGERIMERTNGSNLALQQSELLRSGRAKLLLSIRTLLFGTQNPAINRWCYFLSPFALFLVRKTIENSLHNFLNGALRCQSRKDKVCRRKRQIG